MTYGENIVSVCQDSAGTDETTENNATLQFPTGEKFNVILFENAPTEPFQTPQPRRSMPRPQETTNRFRSSGLHVEKTADIQKT